MTPSQRYQAHVKTSGFVCDTAQQAAVAHFDKLHFDLTHRKVVRLWRQPAARGLYLWGPVGRGKTLLMDMFHASLPAGSALRLHFHRFMALIHRELARESGKADPLKHIAKRLARQYRVLCFDELQVSDIGDAMLLGRLFDALLQQGVMLIATSNLAPSDLYQDGLQRERFIPAIRLLEQHMHIHSLDGGQDHRRRTQPLAGVLLRTPADEQLALQFTRVSGISVTPAAVTSADRACARSNSRDNTRIALCNRDIPVYHQGNGAVWLNFTALCLGPRSSLDYIELARRFHTVLLSDVPVFRGQIREGIKARGTEDGSFTPTTTGDRQVRWSAMDDPARRFISLVDELYDRNVHLYLSTQAPLESLYQQGRLEFEFRRTLSRLTEMQSPRYLGRQHHPD